MNLSSAATQLLRASHLPNQSCAPSVSAAREEMQFAEKFMARLSGFFRVTR
jgi:hypothetical protein